MLIGLLAGFILGFVLAMPPGPIGVTSIKFGLSGDVKPGTQFAYGTALMDALYCVVLVFATSAVKGLFGGFADEHPYLLLLIQTIVVAGFVVIGIVNLRSKGNDYESKFAEKRRTPGYFEKIMERGPFLFGVGLALTNVIHPTFLPTLAYVTLQVHALNIFEATALANLSFAAGFGLGNFLWLYILTRLVVHFRSRMSTLMITRIKQFAGFTFIGFGTYLGYRFFSVVHWSDFFRVVFAF